MFDGSLERFVAIEKRRATYKRLLGANLTHIWHGQQSYALSMGNMQSWTDNVSLVAVTAAGVGSRMRYLADGSLFYGRQQPQSSLLGNRRLSAENLATPVFASGSRPYVFSVLRYRTLDASGNRWAFRFTDQGVTTALMGLLVGSGTTLIMECAGGALTCPADTNPHAVEIFVTPAGVRQAAVDTVSVGTDGTGVSLSTHANRMTLGGNVVQGTEGDVTLPLLLVCAEKPSDTIRAKLYALSRTDVGY